VTADTNDGSADTDTLAEELNSVAVELATDGVAGVAIGVETEVTLGMATGVGTGADATGVCRAVAMIGAGSSTATGGGDDTAVFS